MIDVKLRLDLLLLESDLENVPWLELDFLLPSLPLDLDLESSDSFPGASLIYYVNYGIYAIDGRLSYFFMIPRPDIFSLINLISFKSFDI